MNQRNEQGQEYGYWEFYYTNGQLCYNGNYINGQRHGYWGYYYHNGKISGKYYYNNGIEQGYSELLPFRFGFTTI